MIVTGGSLGTEAQGALIVGETGKWVLSMALGGRPEPGEGVGGPSGFGSFQVCTRVQSCRDVACGLG